jgi:TRAP-type C4-dicarboxylate transport system permease small subunit
VEKTDNVIVRATQLLVTISAYVAGIVLVMLMLLTTADVAGRYFFNNPITGVFDITHFAVLIMTFLSLAYCGFYGGHVAIDILYNHLNRTLAGILNRVVNLIGCVLFSLISWRSLVQSVDVKEFNEASQLVLIPFYPFYYILTFGAGLFAFVMALRIFIPAPEVAPQLEENKS